jgi:hypothetical protein
MDVLTQIGPILSGSGFSFGGVLVTLIVLFARGIIWTKPQVGNLKEELERTRVDQEYWRNAFFKQKDRADGFADRIAELVPLVRVTNKVIDALPNTEGNEHDGQAETGT